MKRRMIILTIDTINAIFKDYVGQVGFPADGKPVKFMLNPKDRKIGLVVESEEFREHEMPVEEIKFDLRRSFLVGGSN